MGLKVWLPLNGDLRNQGCSEVTATASGATVNTSGKIGSCYSFDGSDDFISLSGNTLYNIFKGGSQQFSICFWVYHNDATRAIIFGDYGLSGAIGFNIELTTSHGVRFYWNGSPDKNFNSTSYVTAQGWTHIVITYNGSILNIYRDGILSTDSWSGTLATKNKTAGQFYLGRDSRTGATTLNGRLNDFRIYDHCLSAAEVREISQGLVLHYKFDQTIGYTDIAQNPTTYVVYNNYSGSGTTGTLTNLSETFNGSIVRREVMTPNDTSVNNFKSSLGSHGIYGFRQTFLANTKYVFWIYYRPISHLDIRAGGTASNIGGWTEIPPVAVGNGWYRVGQYRNGTVTTDKTDNIFTSFYTPTAASGVPITIDWASPHLLQGTTEIPSDDSFMGNNIIIDSSGYGHHGIINDTTMKSTSGTSRYSAALQNAQAANSATFPFKGEVNMPESSALTFSWWMKPTTWGRQTSGIFSTSALDSPTDYSTTTANMRDSCFDCCNTSGTCVRINVASYLTLNEWHYYTLTYNGTQLNFYKDGISKVTASQTGSLKAFKNIFPFFSKAGGANRCTSGSLSDFRIYATALDADAIRQLYEVGAKVDNKQNLHTFEIKELSSNIFRSELIMPWAKTTGPRIGEVVEHNDAYALNIAPAPFYQNISGNLSGALNGMFQTGSYVFDMWIDVDSVISGGTNRTGGMIIRYTDDTLDYTFSIVGGNLGYQHKILITPANKNIQRIEFYYYTSTDVFYRIDSCIYPINETKFFKTGVVQNAGFLEDTKSRIIKNGIIEANEIIEL